MSGRTIRSFENGRRQVVRLARRGTRFYAGELDDGTLAVVDSLDEVILAYATPGSAYRFAAMLNALATGDGLPTPEQIEGLLGDGPRGQALLRTIPLKFGGPCRCCGKHIPAGTNARWNRASRLVQHLRRCPSVSAAGRRVA